MGDTTAFASVSREGSATGETFVNEPPGRYSLNINTTNDMQYTISIEECGEGGEANPGEGAQGGGQATQTQDRSNFSQSASSGSGDDRELMQAGGPEDGPVPVMSGGGCPEEFPLMWGGACYR